VCRHTATCSQVSAAELRGLYGKDSCEGRRTEWPWPVLKRFIFHIKLNVSHVGLVITFIIDDEVPGPSRHSCSLVQAVAPYVVKCDYEIELTEDRAH
jgi:hypothetical protein